MECSNPTFGFYLFIRVFLAFVYIHVIYLHFVYLYFVLLGDVMSIAQNCDLILVKTASLFLEWPP